LLKISLVYFIFLKMLSTGGRVLQGSFKARARVLLFALFDCPITTR
jgi:hypothetical protein